MQNFANVYYLKKLRILYAPPLLAGHSLCLSKCWVTSGGSGIGFILYDQIFLYVGVYIYVGKVYKYSRIYLELFYMVVYHKLFIIKQE